MNKTCPTRGQPRRASLVCSPCPIYLDAPAPALGHGHGHGGARARFYALCDEARVQDYQTRRRNLKDHPEDQNVKKFVLAAVRSGEYALGFASEELRGDREVVLAAAQQYTFNLEDASEELRGDREVVLAAVRAWGQMLYAASEELRGDRDLSICLAKTARARSAAASRRVHAPCSRSPLAPLCRPSTARSAVQRSPSTR